MLFPPVALPPRPVIVVGEFVIVPMTRYKVWPGVTETNPDTYAPDPPALPRPFAPTVGSVSTGLFCVKPPDPHKYTRIDVMFAGTVYVRMEPLCVKVVVVTSPTCVVDMGVLLLATTARKLDALSGTLTGIVNG
jgi:hypothetical protein